MQIRHILDRHWRSIVFLIVLTVFFLVVFSLRSALVPFILGLLIAYILRPVILWLEKYTVFPKWLSRQKRPILIIILFIIITAFIVVVLSYSIALIVNEVSQIFSNSGDIVNSVTGQISNLLKGIREHFSPEIRSRIDEIISGGSNNISDALKSIVNRSISLVPTTIGFILGFAAMPVFVFYLMKDWEKLRDGLYKNLPRSAAIHTRNVLSIIGRVIGRYIRAELILGTVVGSVTFVGLLIMRVNFGLALFLGLVSGFFEMVPTLGPWISGFIGAVLILATYPHLFFWAVGLFILIQLLENNLLVPRIQGNAQNIHPAISLMLLVLGAYFAGLWGIVLAIPLTATIVRVFQYTEDAARYEDHLPLLHNDPAIFEK